MNNKAVKVFLSVTLALVVVFGAVAIGMTVKNGRSVIPHRLRSDSLKRIKQKMNRLPLPRRPMHRKRRAHRSSKLLCGCCLSGTI